MTSNSNIVHIPIYLESENVTIALAQLEGPFPDGKCVAMLDERESFVWKSRQQVEERISKASKILDFLNRNYPNVNIVMFPEYSLPVELGVPMLQEWANQNNFIIVAGGDNVRARNTRKVYAQSLIIVPGTTQPIWVRKHLLSSWEKGFVDEAKEISIPLLSWDVGRHRYYAAVFVSLDFTEAIRYSLPVGNSPVIYLVPACSFDNSPFSAHADVLLGEEGSRAILLCNCVGGRSAGGSSVFMLAPDATRRKPLYELSSIEESLAILDLDYGLLAPPRKASPGSRSPLRKPRTFSLKEVVEGKPLQIVPTDVGESRERTQGVINPTLFQLFSKTARVAFFGVQDRSALTELSPGENSFEAYSVLGHTDVMVTHLAEDTYSMFYDLAQVLPWRSPRGESGDSGFPIEMRELESFPYFEVKTYYKVSGVVVEKSDRRAFDDAVPTREELVDLVALAKNWNDSNVSDKTRESFRKRRWILDAIPLLPAEVEAVMTVFLDMADEILQPVEEFRVRVLPELVKMPSIVSICGGIGHGNRIHYLMRIQSALPELLELVEEVHSLARDARVMVTTNTFVLARKLAEISLKKVLVVPELPADVMQFRDQKVLPRLPMSERAQLVSSPEEQQLEFLDSYGKLEVSVKALSNRWWLKEHSDEVLRKLAVGLLQEDYGLLLLPHNVLQSRLEDVIRRLINKHVQPVDFKRIRKALNIPGKKDTKLLTYSERIRVLESFAKESSLEPSLSEDLRLLYANTVDVRNAVAHSDTSRLTINSFVRALESYCSFLQRWDEGLVFPLVRTFFEKAGFEVVREVSNALVVTNLDSPSWREYGNILVKYLEDELVSCEHISSFTNYVHQYGVNERIAFLVHCGSLESGTALRLWEFRNEGFLIIPLHTAAIREAVSAVDPDEAYRLMRRTRDAWTSMGDPYESVDSLTDPQWFIGRDQIIREIMDQVSARSCRPVLVWGMRRVGKTALLNQLESACHNRGYPTVRWLCKQEEPDAILRNIASEFAERVRVLYPQVGLPEVASTDKYDRAFAEQFGKDLSLILRTLRKNGVSGARLVLLIDELELNGFFPGQASPESEYTRYMLFAQALKGVLEQGGEDAILALVAAAEYWWVNEVNEFPYHKPLKNPLFNRFNVKLLTFLTQNECDTLVERIGELAGLQYTQAALRAIFAETQGHPLVTRWLCSCIWKLMQEVTTYRQVTDSVVERAVIAFMEDPLGEVYRSYFEQIFWRNPLSADLAIDQRILAEMAKYDSCQISGLLEVVVQQLDETPDAKGRDRERVESSYERLTQLGILATDNRKRICMLKLPLLAKWIRVWKLGQDPEVRGLSHAE